MTTSAAVNSSGLPSTAVNCRRSGEELTSGRRAVNVTCRERTTRSVAVAVVWSPTAVPRRRCCRTWSCCPWSPRRRTGRRQPFHDAVVVESGDAVRGRREAAPTSKSSRRPRGPRVRSQAALTLPLSLPWRAASVHVVAYVLCSFSFLLVILPVGDPCFSFITVLTVGTSVNNRRCFGTALLLVAVLLLFCCCKNYNHLTLDRALLLDTHTHALRSQQYTQ